MFARLVHLALIAILTGCPVCCQADLCCATASSPGVKVAQRCCSHCSPTDPKSQPDHDAPPSDDSCDCQCICSGALVASAVHVDVSELVLSLDWIAAAAPMFVAAEIQNNSPVDSPHHHRATPGRMICCWHSSLLC